MGISQNIKALRKSLKLNQQEFADKLNVHFTTISKIENETRQPSIDLIYKISETFNISIHKLMSDNYDSVDLHISTSPYLYSDNMAKLIAMCFSCVEMHYKNNTCYSSCEEIMTLSVQQDLFRILEEVIKIKIDLYNTGNMSIVESNMSELINSINYKILDIRKNLLDNENPNG